MYFSAKVSKKKIHTKQKSDIFLQIYLIFLLKTAGLDY